MDSSDSPPSPLHSPPDSPSRPRRHGENPKRHRSSKHLGGSSKELAKLLIYEEKEAQELRSTLHTMSERLKMEIQRAEDAENKVKEVIFRFKEANDARLAAQVEANRHREELNLYKLQLDNAQKELRRAQELLDALESQRQAAEEEAARARGMARKLKEEKIVQLARDEGRKMGVEEGIARGRALGYEEGRATGYARGRSSATKEYMQRYEEDEYEMRGSPIQISVSSSEDSPPVRRSTPPAAKGTPPEDIRIASPGSGEVHSRPHTNDQPVNARSSVHSFTQMTADYPGDDGWIPKVDDDGRVRLPPPHELASPPAQTPALMVPPPLPSQPSVDPEVTTPTEPNTPGRPRYRRRRSTESDSTTMSQFDLLGPPVANSGKASERSKVLSAIVEEKERSSTVSSPQNIGSSPYAYTSSPNLTIPVAKSDLPPHEAATATPRGHYYVRPRSESSSEVDLLAANPVSTTPPERSRSRSTPSLKGSIASNAGFNISVEPPSRPDSHQSQLSATQQEPGLLTAEDAARPPPVEEPPTAQEPPMIIAPQPTGSQLSALSLPLHLPADNQLPPGFVPAGPPQPLSHTPAFAPTGSLGGIYTNLNTPAAIPLPPSSAPSFHRLRSNYTPSVAGSHIPAAEPGVVIPPPSTIPPQASRYSRSALKDSSESSDDASSDLSGSMDTLTTPPPRRISLKSRPPQTPYASYATAPTPPDVTYPLPIPTPVIPPTPISMASGTSRAARVPLPPSTIMGSPTMSSLSVNAGGTSRAARVPLPPSSVGSPRSVYTRLSRKGGSVSGSAVGRG